MICKKAHRHDFFFATLPKDQSDPARHRCAGCAYEAAHAHQPGHGRRAPQEA